MNPISYYLESVYEKTHGYRPTWLPNLPIQIGDFGVLENNVFRKEGNLIGIGVTARFDTSVSESKMDLSSEKGVSITTKLKGKVEPKSVALGQADAGFIIEFKNENSFIFRINGFKTSIIINLAEIKDYILKRHAEGKWDKNMVVINELVTAHSATILLSGQAGAKVELKAQVDVEVESMDIADVSLNLKLESGQSLAAQFLGQVGITPLYRVIGIKKTLFSTSISSKGMNDKNDERQVNDLFIVEEI